MNVLVTCGGSAIMADVVALLRQIPSVESILLVDAKNIEFAHGCQTACVPFGRRAEYPDAMRALVATHGIEFIFVGSDEEALTLSALDWAQPLSHLDTPANTALVLDKYDLHTTLRTRQGDRPLVPAFQSCDSQPALLVMVAQHGSVIARPVRGRGSQGLVHIAADYVRGQFPLAVSADMAKVSLDVFYSEYLPGDKFSADCIFAAGVLRTCMVRNNGPAVKYRPPTMDANTSEDADVFEFATRVGRVLSLSGFHQIECGKASDGSVRLIEINPRLDATLPITKCYPHNFYELLLHRTAVGLMKPRHRVFKRFVVAYTQ